MDLIQNLTDDQFALLGCAVAFLGGLAVLSLSFHLNPANRTESTIQTHRIQREQTETVSDRRAA